MFESEKLPKYSHKFHKIFFFLIFFQGGLSAREGGGGGGAGKPAKKATKISETLNMIRSNIPGLKNKPPGPKGGRRKHVRERML